MKTKLILIFIFTLLSGTHVFGQETTENVKLAFNAGSAKEMIRYFNKITELKINNEGANYSIVKAEPILREFFKVNPPTAFNYIHKGSSPEGLKYNIGQYTSGTKSFRVVVLLKNIEGQYVVDTINITEE
ncbi:MAG: DUF4783 domain-containing protein [Reichenbachiella sp.]